MLCVYFNHHGMPTFLTDIDSSLYRGCISLHTPWYCLHCPKFDIHQSHYHMALSVHISTVLSSCFWHNIFRFLWFTLQDCWFSCSARMLVMPDGGLFSTCGARSVSIWTHSWFFRWLTVGDASKWSKSMYDASYLIGYPKKLCIKFVPRSADDKSFRRDLVVDLVQQQEQSIAYIIAKLCSLFADNTWKFKSAKLPWYLKLYRVQLQMSLQRFPPV